jgi:hypothetical protein
MGQIGRALPSKGKRYSTVVEDPYESGYLRDRAGEIRRSRGDTLVGTLRDEYGKNFALGYRSDTELRTVLKDAGVKTLDQLRRKAG